MRLMWWMQEKNLREFIFHNVFSLEFVASQHHWFLARELLAEFFQFVLEFIFATDGETVWSFVCLGQFQNAIAPVVGALWILRIVDSEVGDDVWCFEIWSSITCTMTDESMPVWEIETNDYCKC